MTAPKATAKTALLCIGILCIAACSESGKALFARTQALAHAAVQRSKNLYVSTDGNDSNDGTRRHPWATISHAGAVASPGSTIHVAPGIYREAVVTTSSGAEHDRIVYVSNKKWKAVIAPSQRAVFTWKNTGDYSDVVGFEIAGTLCVGLGLGGSFQRAISNNVHNSADGCNRPPNGGSGIVNFNYASQGDDIVGNYVHDIAAGDPACGSPQHNLVQGIYQSNAGGHIDHNIAANNCGWGIHLWHAATHASITNNTVTGNRSGGILIGSGDAPCTTTGCPGGDDYTIVSNNIIAFNGGWGLHESGQTPGDTGLHNVYTNNLLFQNAAGDLLLSHNLSCPDCILGQDPKFHGAASGDYRLEEGSPAIGKAKPSQDSTLPLELAVTGHRKSLHLDIGAAPPVKGPE